jgi:hypothetical protein
MPNSNHPLPSIHITVELEPGIVEDKVDPASLHGGDLVGDLVEVVTQDVLLRGREVLSSGGLQLLDVLLGHVDQEGQVGRVSPQADCQGDAWSANGRIA